MQLNGLPSQNAFKKRNKVPTAPHHPSQSSVDVPLQTKDDIKKAQNKICWLCDCKAHKKLRPLEICHIYPQASARRYHFVESHKLGRIRLHNIHDRGNLVALCSICHFAYDCDEWTFIPEDTTDWTQRIEATPQIIQEYNSQRSIVFRRLLLQPDPDSKAFQDHYYKSAFTHSPTKIWSGEPGVVMVRPPFPSPARPIAELRQTLDNFTALQKLWLEYESPCSEENCPICQSNNDEKQGKDDDSDGDEDDEDDEDDGNEEDGEEDGAEDSEENGEEDGEEGGEEDSEEDGEEDEDTSSSRKSRKRISKRQPDSTGQQPPPQDFDIKKSTQANKHRKMLKNTERDWMTSAPYDESIPYSHRYGYTWAGSTSNEVMKLWQVYRKTADG